MARPALPIVVLALAAACGARSGLSVDASAGPDGAPPVDAGTDAGPDASIDAGCVPVDDGCAATERCGDGSNDDCDERVDEGCACVAGTVQPCFLGPPGRRAVGACQDGSQVCTGSGAWGPCVGGIVPDEDGCTGRDDLCNGCSEDRVCQIDCPSPGDPRVPNGTPFSDYPLRAGEFYRGEAEAFRWRVRGGPCDRLAPALESFELHDPRTADATFVPRLSGDYTITLEVTTPGGELLDCSWIVHVDAPGLRIEMCYPESETQDLDLYLHRPDDETDWYTTAGSRPYPIPEASCGWHNCEAMVRLLMDPRDGGPVSRADWGYEDSPLSACVNGPQGDLWGGLGSCANPRLDIDNNLSEGTGLPENINVDHPRDGERFRVMVRNFSGEVAHPVVNVYCAGRRVATYGQRPDVVPMFEGPHGGTAIGTMWRVADVTVEVDASGETTGCDVRQLHPRGETSGYHVTYNDPRYLP